MKKVILGLLLLIALCSCTVNRGLKYEKKDIEYFLQKRFPHKKIQYSGVTYFNLNLLIKKEFFSFQIGEKNYVGVIINQDADWKAKAIGFQNIKRFLKYKGSEKYLEDKLLVVKIGHPYWRLIIVEIDWNLEKSFREKNWHENRSAYKEYKKNKKSP